MLARRLPSILPPLEHLEAVETLAVYSVAGLLGQIGTAPRRPFRAPHHTISSAGLVGGGSVIRPGEISLAHNGVLFLDELPEFGRGALEALRQPLEEGRLTIARARSVVTLPARFQLVAAANPCPCGYYGSTQRNCTCGQGRVARYQGRVSGPMLDRVDLHVMVAQPSYTELRATPGHPESAAVRDLVERAREVQRVRYASLGIQCNSQLPTRAVERHCALDASSERMLQQQMSRGRMGARTVTRALRVARTIADLDGAPRIGRAQVAEALALRMLDEAPSEKRMLDSYAPVAGENDGKTNQEVSA